jgi:hypothetical protein
VSKEHLASAHDVRMSLTAQVALLSILTMGVGVLMVVQGLQAGMIRRRGVQRCAACRRLIRPYTRCSCADEDVTPHG